MEEARLWKPVKEGKVLCQLCSHYCLIAPNERGKCAVRVNQEGKLFTLTSTRVAAMGIDPVEKKPLYHFMPGSKTFSIGTMGCNLSCSFCQNFSLSMPPREDKPVSGQHATPEMLVQGALDHDAGSISYTYSEPTIFFELMQDTATMALDKGLKNIMITNGFMTRNCLDELGPLVQAANVDLKAFHEEFYEEICGARLEPVLDNLIRMKELEWWLEVTTLVIPDANDSDTELERMALFIRDELGPDTPWHLSRFHPAFRMQDRGPTPLETIERAYTIGKDAGLNYVYLGNVPGSTQSSTYCPDCGTVCIDRQGSVVSGCSIREGKCPNCGTEIQGYGFGTEISM